MDKRERELFDEAFGRIVKRVREAVDRDDFHALAVGLMSQTGDTDMHCIGHLHSVHVLTTLMSRQALEACLSGHDIEQEPIERLMTREVFYG